jgi:REP element-mobilizing transposase RayT
MFFPYGAATQAAQRIGPGRFSLSGVGLQPGANSSSIFLNRSMILINRERHASGELWQGRFFDRAFRTVKEYNEKVEYIHLNPVKAGLVRRAGVD